MDLRNLSDEELGILAAAKGIGRVTRGQAAMRGATTGYTFGLNEELTAASEASGLMGPQSRLGGMLPGVRPEVRERVNRMPADPVSAGIGAVRMGLERVAPNTFGRGASDQYEETLIRERERNQEALDAYPGSYIAGGVAGAAANPLHWAMPAGRATAAGRAVQGAKIAAPISAAHGFGQGEGGFLERLRSAGVSGALGIVLGGGTGAAVGPRAGSTVAPASSRATDVAEAAARQNIDVPLSVATDSRIVQEAGYRSGQLPWVVGKPMRDATARAGQQLEDGVSGVAQSIGGTTRETAGDSIQRAGSRWINQRMRDIDDRVYGRVNDLMPSTSAQPLTSTRRAVQEVTRRAKEGAVPDPSVATVREAIARDGMTFDGMQRLRSHVGTKLAQARRAGSTTKGGLGRLYAALSDDMQSLVEAQGGPAARRAWHRANRIHELMEDRKSEIARVIGRQADAEPTQVFNRLQAIMTDARSNTSRLSQVRRAVGPDAWDDFSGAVVSQLGRNRAGEFQPGQFVSDWNRMTPRAKQMLIRNEQHRKSINDYVTIAERFRDQHRQFANPSGSATTGTAIGMGAWLLSDAQSAVVGGLGGHMIAHLLSRPATAQSIARYSRAFDLLARKPSQGSARAAEQAARKLAADIGSEINVPVDHIMRSLTQTPSRAADENQP